MSTNAQINARRAVIADARALYNEAVAPWGDMAKRINDALPALDSDGGESVRPLVAALNTIVGKAEIAAPMFAPLADAADAMVPDDVTPPSPVVDLAMSVAQDSDLGAYDGTLWTNADPTVQTHTMRVPGVLAYVDWSSTAKVVEGFKRSAWYDVSHRAWWSPSTIQPGWPRTYAADGSYAINAGAGSGFMNGWPEFYRDRGLAFMAAASGLFPRLINGLLFCGLQGRDGNATVAGDKLRSSSDNGGGPASALLFAPHRHLFFRYCIVIEPDVKALVNGQHAYVELGTKLSGFGGGPGGLLSAPFYATPNTGFANVGETGSPWIPYTDSSGVVGPPGHGRSYIYDMSVQQGVRVWPDAPGSKVGMVLPIGVPITIEQEMDMGDPSLGVHDCPSRWWVNDVLVLEDTIHAQSDLPFAQVQIYMGGTRPPLAPIHYRIGATCIATRKIGVPRELRSGTPPPILRGA